MSERTHNFEKFLAITNAILCTIICIRITQTVRTDLFPFPVLYLIELISLSVAVVFSVFRDDSGKSRDWGIIIWVAAGIFLTFSLLGAWTVGLFFLPSTLLFFLLGIFSDLRQGRNLLIHIGIGLLAGGIQATFMINAIRLL